MFAAEPRVGGGAQAPACAGLGKPCALSGEVNALTRDIIALEQETDAHLRKCAQFAAEEAAWLAVSREAPRGSLTGSVRDVREKLAAAQQDLNDTSLAHEAEVLRRRQATERVSQDLQAARWQESEAAEECRGLRGELREATRAAVTERSILQEPARWQADTREGGGAAQGGGTAAYPAEGVAAQKARSEALFELASARREAAAAGAQLRGCEEALSEARQQRASGLEAAAAGLAELERAAARDVFAGPLGSRLEAADRVYLESCKRSEELLNRVATWRGFSTSSRARAEAAEGKAQRAAQRQVAAEEKAAEARGQLEASALRLAEALQEKEKAQSALEAARVWRRAACATLALALSFATARALTLAGLSGR